ncbi:Oxysterol-binding protein-like protein 1 [Fulvia fulva]|uniref:Oxysterol-binding protein-like protein 1 n=1 Tax=Passalora fulva TaxID=5499 RepID=A0A9Q8PJ54_PASFU|nr:Oxysterol-binding protein-like protein 1 [Fulvia fulva]KAK4612320.1 Oxysterol-binding protein-like protein 1 [Fulvia fulva]KAK4612553.1 Oxysterol-binding protein-like protein 1 [Fulvia fulva]UJO23511.1 Oxysterol-binding protein-like protein 1 [Fulvia fulva]WPV21211.1 Oxysterol-binding protein-like protein 1 [Fulvia fulva]WPV36491.1 Oxysterol-binding protein-like protein 1 [Fulvia fulva]
MVFGHSKKTSVAVLDSPATSTTSEPSSTTHSADNSAKTSMDSNGTPIKAKEELAQAAAVDGQTPSDTSKLKTFLGILRRFVGVTDMAAVRFSLPAQLMEPIPNLEYWHYLDRPETFAAIGDAEDPLERMLGCLRFWFTKDLKYVKGKPCKPYNSSLGEFFRCTWEVEDQKGQDNKPLKVNYITEQTSHHPPVSAFAYDCPEKGVEAMGYDQLSAKFTGTSIKVTPGQYNQGIFIRLKNRDNEEYKLTHPAAFLGGFLRGNLSITVADTCYVECEKTGLKTILHYLEEGYFGKTQNKVEGVIYKSDSIASDNITRLKDVPTKQILGRIEGVWTEKIYFTSGATEFKKVAEKDRVLVMDVTPLLPIAKKCPPLEQQLPNESRRFWNDVTEFITSKQFAQATTRKQQLEERQRERAAEREKAGEKWQPRFFTTVTESSGKAVLSEEGKRAMEGLQKEEYVLKEPESYGAL